MAGLCDGRVVVITGAGRGLGRSHALAFAAEGAKVVVNDLGASVDGTGASAGPAQEVVDEIRAMGGEAVVNGDDVSDFDGAKSLVDQAVDTFGRLDVLVNNAGILRDKMLVNMDIAEWDAVVRVHLRGTFCPTRHAAAYWRERSKAGEEVDGRVICTSSPSGLYGNVGQTNYGAAKAGIAAFVVIASEELRRYGVTVNAIAPAARTRMTTMLGMDAPDDPGSFDLFDPDNVSPIVVWLGSPESSEVTGRVFETLGGRLAVVDRWHRGKIHDKQDRYTPSELGPVVKELLELAEPTQPFLMS
jgi:NAD(P)-dependent dehydrogenase (short-subunit alcohol dehydrogenase family)